MYPLPSQSLRSVLDDAVNANDSYHLHNALRTFLIASFDHKSSAFISDAEYAIA